MTAKPTKIFFVDDDAVTCRVMKRNCDNAEFQCETFQDAKSCLNEFKKTGANIVITDLRMPNMNGFDLLSELRSIDEDVPVVVMTGYSSVENAVEAMKRGANDFIKKPFEFNELKLMLERTIKTQSLRNENKLLKRRIGQKRNRFGMIGDTPVMRTLFNTIEKVAEVSCSSIITGQSGTGKELVARALHDYSPRSDKPFVAIDCGALSETLLESELFGYEKGAFTGAHQRKYGLMEQADGGTLFLDEICNISDKMQMKLMRAIEDHRVVRVGGTSSIPVDVRVIAASNQDLEKMVAEGALRHDFYHRLNVVTIRVPPLKEHREDIPALVEYYLKEYSERYQRQVKGFDTHSMNKLFSAEWMGNVRELRNTVERCVILSDGPILNWSGADNDALHNNEQPMEAHFSNEEFLSLIDLEQVYIKHVLKCCDGKKTKAAKILGIDKTTLWRKLRRYEGEGEKV